MAPLKILIVGPKEAGKSTVRLQLHGNGPHGTVNLTS
ncbi:hypothetical protein PF010_g29754, partial [Phytophthora fragariae]